MSLGFACVAATSAVLGLVDLFSEANRDAFADWCGEYAHEVEDYIDTIDVLLDDDAYREFVEIDAKWRTS